MSKSIDAYSDGERVRRYDSDMDLMHPLRHKMVEVALEVLPFASDAALNCLDLGSGTGFFTQRFLTAYPNASVIAVDGSGEMNSLAAARLGDLTERTRLVTSSFETLAGKVSDRLDVVFTAYALHHLSAAAKREVLAGVVGLLEPGGWYLSADIHSNPSPEIEKRIQQVRVAGILERNQGRDERFDSADKIRAFLDGLEDSEGDQPLPVEEDIELLQGAGLANATIFWKEYREAVIGGSVVA